MRTSDGNVWTAVAAQLAYGKGMAIPGDKKVYGRLERSVSIAQQHRDIGRGRRQIVNPIAVEIAHGNGTRLSAHIEA